MTEYAPELSPYTTQVSTANNHTEHLVASVTALALGLGGVRAVAGGAAADFQKMSSGMAAASTVTHQSMGRLGDGVRALQREFPLTTQAALQTVQSVQALGLTARNQVAQVGALSKTMTQLAGATGEFGPALAQSFGQLTRQMASLDPRRVQSFADSLTALHARSGASAQSIAQFAQSIAPMAQAAGLGEASVLGIATSFSKVGQDGYVAANTVSKMMSDMSRSVRDGSNDMAGYANVVGMTASQFSKLFRNNPAEAITRVSEAIAKMPTGQGQRSLEMLGIEGVRSQRALLSVAQSGGMRADIATAVNNYGSGATATASAAAYRGVSDSLTRLENATSQVAEAFERPLLGAVTHVVNAASGFAGGVGGIVGSRPVQAALGAASSLVVPLALAHVATRVLSTGALGSLLLRSGPVTGLVAGAGAGRAGSTAAAFERIPRTQAVANMMQADLEGAAMGRTAASASANRALYNIGAGMGAMFPRGDGTGPGFFRSMRGYGVLGASMAMRSQAEMYRLARMPAMERDAYLMRPYGEGAEHLAQRRTLSRLSIGQEMAGPVTSAQAAAGQTTLGTFTRRAYFAGLNEELGRLAVATGGARNAIALLGRSFGTLAMEMGRTAAAGTRAAVGGLARGAMGMVGGPIGIAMIAGTVGYEAYRSNAADMKRRQESYDNLDIFGTVNAYRDAMGQAGESTTNLSTQMDAAAQSVSAAVTTISQATSVTSGDVAAAQRSKNITQHYAGSESQVAAQIAAINTRGLRPSDIQGAKIDLLRQQQAGELPANFNIDQTLGMAARNPGFGRDQIDQMVAGMSRARGLGHVGFGYQRVARWVNNVGDLDHRGQWENLGNYGAGSPQLGQARGQVDLLAGALGQRQMDMTSRFGRRYAAGQTLHSADQAMAAALRTHNADLVVGMEQELSSRLTGKALTGISAAELQRAGSFSALLSQHGRRVNGVDVNTLLAAGPGNRARLQEDSVAQTLLGSSATQNMGRFFSNFSQGPFNRGRNALTAAANAPEDLEKQNKAVMAIVDSGTKAGMSLGDLASQAAHTTSTMADGDARRAVMVGVIAEATRRLQVQMGGMTIGQRFQAQGQMALRLSQTTGNSPEAQAARAQGVQQAGTVVQSEREYMQQRIQAQFQFEVQSQRSYHDYYLGVSRANEDFQRGMARSEEDFQRQRYRQLRDFNISQQRQREDAARTLYDPYQRIQAQPVYDAGNLLMNTREQLQAMRQQVANIRQLRSMGLDEATIRMLGLYDPKNAQQTQELVNDMRADHSLVGQFNRNAHARERVAGQLLSEDPNFRRQRADFRRQLRDSGQDYQIARDRQIADFHLQMSRQATDFATQMQRMVTDLHNADRELTGDMTSLQADMHKILHGQQVDWSTQLKNNLDDTINYITAQTPRLLAAQNNALSPKAGGGGGYGSMGGLPSANANTQMHWGGSAHSGNRAVIGYHNVNGERIPRYGAAGSYVHDFGKVGANGVTYPIIERMADHGPPYSVSSTTSGKHAGTSYHYKGEAVDFIAGSPQGMEAIAHYFAANFGHRLTELIWAGPGAIAIKNGVVVDGPQVYKDVWNDHRTHVHVAATPAQLGDAVRYAEGGIGLRPHIGMVAEAGTAEAMIPLDRRGIGVLADAFAQFMPDAMRLTGGGGQPYAMHLDQSSVHHYDQRRVFEIEKVEVAADDPATFSRKMEAKAARDNLTEARGVPWSRN